MRVIWNEKSSRLTVNYYSKNAKGYMVLGFTVENAISFFKSIKKLCESDKEKDEFFVSTVLSDGKSKITMYREDACGIRPILAEELNFITGKKKRPEKKKMYSIDVKE